MLVSVIIPIFRQEKTIKQDLTNIYNTMKGTRWDFEIIAVVDGSPDKSFLLAKEVENEKLKVFGYQTNRGKGYAVRYGMARSSGQYVVFIDSGMDINPNGISMLLEHMEWYDADIVIASKNHPESKVKYTLMRKIYSFGYYFIVRLLFGLKVSDTQTGLKVFKREVLEKVLPRLLVKAFAFDIELLAVSYHLGYKKIYEAPVELSLDFTDGSKFSKSKLLFLDPEIRHVLLDTLAVFYRLKVKKYYDDKNERAWVFDEALEMKINTGK